MARKLFFLMIFVIAGLVACNPVFEGPPISGPEAPTVEPQDEPESSPMGQGMGMGPGSGMMQRHHAPIPAEYAGLSNPIEADEESLNRGSELYNEYCVTCHGEGGMGDGPAGQQLNPQPAPIAHTSRMLGDDYMFWRISEGGLHEPFSSAMPRWQDLIDENARWDLINYVRALGTGQVVPGQQTGGAVFDPELEAARHAEMAAKGVAQGLITQSEAGTFLSVHEELDKLMAAEMAGQSGTMATMQEVLLNQLLEEKIITDTESAVFQDVHDRLLAAGLME